MASTRIADIFNPLTFGRLIDEAAIELNKFIRSGIVVPSALLQNQIIVGGNKGTLTGFQPLGTQEPNISTDDPTSFSVPQKITKNEQDFRLANLNESWSTMNLASELALKKPVPAITSKIGGYWATQFEKRVIQFSLGVLADNVANDSSDMLVTVATDDAGAVTDAERISADVVLDTKQTLGDHSGSLSTIAMPSTLLTRLQKQNLITFIPNARGEIVIPTYLGYVVVEDDSMPAVAGSNRITYTCILYGTGAFGSAEGSVEVPAEINRLPTSGLGGGEDVIHSRMSILNHVFGMSWADGSVAGQSADLAELALAVNHDRIWNRKNIPIAFLQVND